MLPHGDRSGVVIEPWLTDQWYCDAATLAQPAIKAVEEGRTVFVPKQWENTYFEWMRNIQPWCISRQIWWGHQIPAWYGPDGTVFVEETEDEAKAAAAGPLRRVRPTLTPRSGRARHLVLLGALAVLDARLAGADQGAGALLSRRRAGHRLRHHLLLGRPDDDDGPALHGRRAVPHVYIHALVRDERGQKMSKSKGNVIDPLELIDEYGCDALRFTLAALAAQGRDIKLAVGRVEGYRNFATKLWNAARYCQMNECVAQPGFDPKSVKLTVNRWIVGEVAKTAARVAEALEAYRFNEAAGALYHFTWGTFCDWYLEFTKPILNGDDAEAKAETRATTGWVLDEILHLLHPFMPFITEELWEKLGTNRENGLIRASWPEFGPDIADASAQAEMDWVVRLISTVRGVRSEMNVPAGAQIPLLLKDASPETVRRLDTYRDIILRMARLSSADTTAEAAPKGAIQAVLDEATVVLPLAGVIDLDQEKARLSKEIDKLTGEITKIDQKLEQRQLRLPRPRRSHRGTARPPRHGRSRQTKTGRRPDPPDHCLIPNPRSQPLYKSALYTGRPSPLGATPTPFAGRAATS